MTGKPAVCCIAEGNPGTLGSMSVDKSKEEGQSMVGPGHKLSSLFFFRYFFNSFSLSLPPLNFFPSFFFSFGINVFG